MWQYTTTDEMHHHGIKGMKWGVRKYQKKDGSLTPAGIKRYAKKGYAEDSLNSVNTVGKLLRGVTHQHKIDADLKYFNSSNKKNKERAEKYLNDREAEKNTPTKEKVKRLASKGAVAAASALGSAAALYTYDQMVNGGRGTEAAGKAIKTLGRVAVSAVVYASGGRDIRWYDK